MAAEMCLSADLCLKTTISREMSRRLEVNIRSGPERLKRWAM